MNAIAAALIVGLVLADNAVRHAIHVDGVATARIRHIDAIVFDSAIVGTVEENASRVDTRVTRYIVTEGSVGVPQNTGPGTKVVSLIKRRLRVTINSIV